MHQIPPGWTPSLVGEVLVDTLRWAAASAGRVGPSGFVTAQSLQQYRATEADFAKEGWGLPEVPGDDEPWLEPVRLHYTLDQIRLFQRAIHWQYCYLYPDYQEVGRVLGVWLRTRARKGAFDRQVAALGYSKRHCYRMRDRGLSLIARGLHRDGVPMPERQTLSEWPGRDCLSVPRPAVCGARCLRRRGGGNRKQAAGPNGMITL